MKWVAWFGSGFGSTHYLVDDEYKPYIVVEYNKDTRMWGWRRYATRPASWHDMPGVRGREEACAVALAQWRMG